MRILITSGGGAKGAFTVGALKFLKEQKGISSFDLISGTSTGALIAAMMAVGKVETLVDVYRNTTNSDVLDPENVLVNIQKKRPFIYNTHPLLRQIETHIDDAVFNDIMNSGTKLCLNAISLQTGMVTIFATKFINFDPHYEVIRINNRQMLIDALLGSSNQAVFLNPIPINGEQYVDGGNREVVPTRVVVSNIDEAEDHEIYVLSNNPVKLVEFRGKTYTSILDVLTRAISIFIQEIRETDMETLANFKDQSTGMIKIFYINPKEELDREFTTGLRFDFALMEAWLQEGFERARDVMRDSPNGNFPFL